MYDAFTDWVKAVLGSGYQYRHGAWEETEPLKTSMVCSFHATGGAAPDVDDRRPRYRVLLLGSRGDRAAAQVIKNDIHSLAQAALGDTLPCGAAGIRALGEPAGPGYTTENRAWWSLDFQITY